MSQEDKTTIAVPPKGATERQAVIRWSRPSFSLGSLLTFIAVLSIVVLCVKLWQFPLLRPYLASGGAGIAAFLGPLPGLLSPETRGKWVASVVVAALITVGTWFATEDLSARWREAEQNHAQAVAKLNSVETSTEQLINTQRPEVRDALFLSTGKFYHGLYNKHQFRSIVDIALVMLAVDPDNGHGLYYAGEANHMLGNQKEMVLYYQRYVADADHHPESRNGDAKVCYDRPSGYCQERLAWIDHEMANYYLGRADLVAGEQKLDPLRTALNYEAEDLDVRPSGFYDNPQEKVPSTCDVLSKIAKELSALNAEAGEVRTVREKLSRPCPST